MRGDGILGVSGRRFVRHRGGALCIGRGKEVGMMGQVGGDAKGAQTKRDMQAPGGARGAGRGGGLVKEGWPVYILVFV